MWQRYSYCHLGVAPQSSSGPLQLGPLDMTSARVIEHLDASTFSLTDARQNARSAVVVPPSNTWSAAISEVSCGCLIISVLVPSIHARGTEAPTLWNNHRSWIVGYATVVRTPLITLLNANGRMQVNARRHYAGNQTRAVVPQTASKCRKCRFKVQPAFLQFHCHV